MDVLKPLRLRRVWIVARSRAFLDYEGNSLDALRAADASQGIMRTRMIDGGAME